jgi:hypothetical protein
MSWRECNFISKHMIFVALVEGQREWLELLFRLTRRPRHVPAGGRVGGDYFDVARSAPDGSEIGAASTAIAPEGPRTAGRGG